MGRNRSAAYFVATASASTGAASRNHGRCAAAARTTIQAASASRNSAGASYVAKLPRKIVGCATANAAAAHSPTRGLNSIRVIEYSSPVVQSMTARLTSRAAARPPRESVAPASTG